MFFTLRQRRDNSRLKKRERTKYNSTVELYMFDKFYDLKIKTYCRNDVGLFKFSFAFS